MSATQGKHRIILFNFTKKQADEIEKAGYNVERGFVGRGNEGLDYLPYATPHPIYEYDILFYNSHIPDEVSKEFSEQASNGLVDRSFVQSVSSFRSPPPIRVSFIGESEMSGLTQGGVPFLELIHADENVSVSALHEIKDSPWRIPELHRLLLGLKTEISSVGQFVRGEDSASGIWRVPVLAARNGEVVMCYGRVHGDDNKPYYIVLPQMAAPARTAIEILQCLENLVPTMFPDRVKSGWLHGDEFALPEELSVDQEIKRKSEETKEFIAAKQHERSLLEKGNAFVRGLLVAKEDPGVPVEERLSSVVRASLEFLEFNVEDIDQKTKTAIKKEDFWVRDGNFLAITEVTGTENKNPKVKEFNDILGRMATLYKRQTDLVLPVGANIVGLLVLNYDIGTHPSKRPRVYIGQDAHIIEAAEEQGIGILSTVELHKIVVGVKRGALSKGEARKLIKKAGRIEYAANAALSEDSKIDVTLGQTK